MIVGPSRRTRVIRADADRADQHADVAEREHEPTSPAL